MASIRIRFGAFLAIIGFGVVHAIPYDGPVATPVLQRFADSGWTPKPTTIAMPLLELFKRAESPEFCGYLEGNGDLPVTCRRGSSCMYDESFSWFGCCTGSVVTDCNVLTACVASASINACLKNPECYEDPFVLPCSSRARPFCLQLYTVITGATYGHFECASTAATLEVIATTTDSLAPSFSLGSKSTTRKTSVSNDGTKTGTRNSQPQFTLSGATDGTTRTGTGSASVTPTQVLAASTTATTGAAARRAEMLMVAVPRVVGVAVVALFG